MHLKRSPPQKFNLAVEWVFRNLSGSGRSGYMPRHDGESSQSKPDGALRLLRGVGWRQRCGLDFGQIELARGMIDIEADDISGGIEIDNQTLDDLVRLGARPVLIRCSGSRGGTISPLR